MLTVRGTKRYVCWRSYQGGELMGRRCRMIWPRRKWVPVGDVIYPGMAFGVLASLSWYGKACILHVFPPSTPRSTEEGGGLLNQQGARITLLGTSYKVAGRSKCRAFSLFGRYKAGEGRGSSMALALTDPFSSKTRPDSGMVHNLNPAKCINRNMLWRPQDSLCLELDWTACSGTERAYVRWGGWWCRGHQGRPSGSSRQPQPPPPPLY